MSAPSSSESVKVFFVEPTDHIKTIMSVLIRLNFEVYSVQLKDAYRLAAFVKTLPRSVVYLCLLSSNDALQWLAYVDHLQKTHAAHIQFGVFVSALVARPAAAAFLKRGVAVIDLSFLQANTLETLKRILLCFEAREKRKFVRARAVGPCQVHLKFATLQDSIKGDLIEISIHAFSAKLEVNDKVFFNAGEYVPEATIILRGKRIRVAARFMGFDRAAPETAVFLLSYPSSESGAIVYRQQLPRDIRNAVYEYIEYSLREDMKMRLAALPEERPSAEHEPLEQMESLSS